MRFYKSVLTIASLMILISCTNSSSEQNSTNAPDTKEMVDVTLISQAILDTLKPIHLDTSNYTILKNTGLEEGKPFSLSSEEIKKLETVLNHCVSENNKDALHHLDSIYNTHPNWELMKHKDVVINIANYKMQIIPWINKAGERELLAFGFCHDPCPDKGRWRNSLVHNLDGSTCNFGVKINLTKANWDNFWTMGTSERPIDADPCF